VERGERRALIGLHAVKDDLVLSWDVLPEVIGPVVTRLTSEGWRVSILVGDEPRRRRLPRIDRSGKGHDRIRHRPDPDA
jgi:hypothetical protein